ncbi:inositol monophosphatase [Candidatus Babeliales bacterium]|nr:inositol monophosphatase [Candidatus Babeliales bacterium]
MKYVKQITEIIKQAGVVARSYDHRMVAVHRKSDGSFYTDADVAVQEFLIQKLVALVPGSGVIAEELSCNNPQPYTWVIDPIDGTKNFIKGLPYWGITIALMHHDQVIVAATHMPVMGDLVYAQLGQGCWYNDVMISKGTGSWHRQNVGVLMTVAGSVPTFQDRKTQVSKAIQQMTGSVVSKRQGGAVAVDLAYVAAGALDVAVLGHMNWWDVAAGTLLVAEAGGMVVQQDLTMVKPDFVWMVAGNRTIAEKIASMIA